MKLMKNSIIEHEGKAYIVEKINEKSVNAIEYVYDINTEKYVRVGEVKNIKEDYNVIPISLVKVKYSVALQEGEEDEQQSNSD